MFGALQPVERHHQRGDAARAGVPVGQPRIIVDQPAERGLHDGEGGSRLHHLSERHAAVEKFRRAQQQRHHGRDQARSLRHQRGAHVLAGQPRPLPQHVGKGLVDAVALFLLAAEQRDALAVLAHPRQRVAVFGLGLVLVLGHLHEAASDGHDRAGGDGGIDHGGDHQKAGNGQRRSADRHRQRAADGPEHRDEGRGRQKCRGDAGDEIDRRVGGDPQILGDAVFRILVVAADQVELVVAAVGEPARDHRIGQPGAPAALNAHARVHLRHAEQHAADRERKEHRGEMEDADGILLLDGVEDRPVPDVDAVLKADIGDDQDQQTDRENPRQPVAAFAPEAARADPEPRQQIILARLLGLFLGPFRIGLDHFRRRRFDMLAVFGGDIDDLGFLVSGFSTFSRQRNPSPGISSRTVLTLQRICPWRGNARDIRRFHAGSAAAASFRDGPKDQTAVRTCAGEVRLPGRCYAPE